MQLETEQIISNACRAVNNDEVPYLLLYTDGYRVKDSDGLLCGTLAQDEKLMAAYLAGQESINKKYRPVDCDRCVGFGKLDDAYHGIGATCPDFGGKGKVKPILSNKENHEY